MITKYLREAMHRARYKILEDGTYYGWIEELPCVWANAGSLEECREDLGSVVDGSDQTNLTNNPARDDQPAWSPGGTKIAFVSDRTGNREIHIMNADDTGQTNLICNSPTENSTELSSTGSETTKELV
jgi:dipeptidyl aminopeptidase/acylaminoacyl peptidase